jgi:DNA-binding XRE family transcriptional regulator
MPKTIKNEPTTDAVEILHRDLIGDDPQAAADYEQVKADLAVARRIFGLRMSAGLTQAQLAKRIGTSRTVISRLEDADYEGHSLAMLNRIANALDQRVEIRFVPTKRARTTRLRAATPNMSATTVKKKPSAPRLATA